MNFGFLAAIALVACCILIACIAHLAGPMLLAFAVAGWLFGAVSWLIIGWLTLRDDRLRDKLHRAESRHNIALLNLERANAALDACSRDVARHLARESACKCSNHSRAFPSPGGE